MIEYNDLFSERVKDLKASEVRELLKLTMRPEIISFAGGLPNPKSFPMEDIFRISQSVLLNSGEDALQYTTTEGYPELRKFLAARERSVSVLATEENILITSGSQQGLELVAKTFINPGDKIIVESPSYLGGLSAFKMYQAQFETVPLEEDGADLDRLREILDRSETRPKLFYTVPTFQNPSGITYSKDKRKELAEIAYEYDLTILEDNPYEKLRFAGNRIKSIKAYAPENTIYLSTFSKVLSPGFRLAWICAPKEVIDKLIIVKQATDLCSNSYVQHITYQLLLRGLIDRHVPWIAAMYKEKRDIMLDAMEKYFPEGVTWTRPDGGMFIWVTLPEHINAKEMFPEALKENVAYVHGGAFHVEGGFNHMRLAFIYESNENIVEGIKRLGMVIKNNL
ncbi:MAG TPA: PLP-dependent aminotransferase family protein [Candidatus Methanofastidiosa archaeon]|nr:PLP-dependent aminotransferase family protein [Candidatus Methanofastidiosa archaeon]